MSNLSQFFASQGPHFTDPNRFPKWTGAGNSATSGIGGSWGGFVGMGSNTIWGDNYFPVQTSSTFTGGVYQTLLNVASGRGIVFGIMSPAVANAADNVYFRITVDGAQTIITIPSAAVNYRIWLGYMAKQTIFTTASNGFGISSAPNPSPASSVQLYNLGSAVNWVVLSPFDCDLFGIGGLSYSTSLLVEIKVDTTQSASANFERNAGVSYVAGR